LSHGITPVPLSNVAFIGFFIHPVERFPFSTWTNSRIRKNIDLWIMFRNLARMLKEHIFTDVVELPIVRIVIPRHPEFSKHHRDATEFRNPTVDYGESIP